MKLYFKQTPNTMNRTMDRLMGGLILQGKEYDVVGSPIATLEEQVLGSSRCTIVGINGIQGTVEKMSKEGRKGYIGRSGNNYSYGLA